MQETHKCGGPASAQARLGCCGHQEPGEGWASPLGAQRCPGAPPVWPPVFPKAPRRRTPWASPVRGSSPWPTMLRTCSAQVSEELGPAPGVGGEPHGEGGVSLHRQSHFHLQRQSTCSSWKISLPSKGALGFLGPPNQATDLSQPDIPAGKRVLMGATEPGDHAVGPLLPGCRMGGGYPSFHN